MRLMYRGCLVVLAAAAAPVAAEQLPDWLQPDPEPAAAARASASPERNTEVVPPPFGGPFIEEQVIRSRTETAADRAAARAPAPEVQPAVPEPGSRYQVQPGDVVVISVWNEPDLLREITISPDGWITYPLVGAVRVEGMTVDAIGAEVTAKLSRFINTPAVNVTLREIVGNRIYVTGRVNRPGVFTFAKRLDVVQALSMAGGPSTFADRDSVRVLRREEGRQLVFDVNYADIERGRNLEDNILLESGDVVVVP